jgi:hypothetical protein
MLNNQIIIFLLLIIFIFLLILKKSNNTVESKSKKAIALLTINPNKIWLNFLLTFVNNYDVYIFIDNNKLNLEEYKIDFKKLNFIQINNNECILNGYSNSSYIIKSDPISWDKALYYFTIINNNYDYIWFIEDDVFINSVNNLINLDNKYPKSDLIVKANNIYLEGDESKWSHWLQVNDTLKLPWSMSMICICRLSKELLLKINDYTKIYKKLNFIEFLFNTLALHNNLIISNPTEFDPITFRKDWNINNINKNNLYHPIKNISDHEYIRNIKNTLT